MTFTTFSCTALKGIDDHKQGDEEEHAVEVTRSDHFLPSYFVALRTMQVLSVGEEASSYLVVFTVFLNRFPFNKELIYVTLNAKTFVFSRSPPFS